MRYKQINKFEESLMECLNPENTQYRNGFDVPTISVLAHTKRTTAAR